MEDGAGSRANAVLFNQQDFEQLRSECLQTGSLFCDPTFPADWDSLGYNELGRYSSKTSGMEWKRPWVSETCNITVGQFSDQPSEMSAMTETSPSHALVTMTPDL